MHYFNSWMLFGFLLATGLLLGTHSHPSTAIPQLAEATDPPSYDHVLSNVWWIPPSVDVFRENVRILVQADVIVEGRLFMYNCTVHFASKLLSGSPSGFYVQLGGYLELTSSLFEQAPGTTFNYYFGVRDMATAKIISSTITQAYGGITFGGTFFEVHNSYLANMSVAVTAASSGVMSGNVISDVITGVMLKDCRDVVLTDNTINSSGYSTTLMHGSDVNMSQNSLQSTLGVMVEDVQDLFISNNSFHSPLTALTLFDVTNFTLTKNNFSDSQKALLVTESANGSVSNNSFHNHENQAMHLKQSHFVSFVSNDITGGSGSGALITGSSNIFLSHNKFSDLIKGLVLQEGTAHSTIATNTFDRVGTAVLLQEFINLTMSWNIFSDATTAVNLTSGTELLLLSNTFSNTLTSLAATTGVTGRVERNHFSLGDDDVVVRMSEAPDVNTSYVLEFRMNNIFGCTNFWSCFDFTDGRPVVVRNNYYADVTTVDLNNDGFSEVSFGADSQPLAYPADHYIINDDGEVTLGSPYNPPINSHRSNVVAQPILGGIFLYFTFALSVISLVLVLALKPRKKVDQVK